MNSKLLLVVFMFFISCVSVMAQITYDDMRAMVVNSNNVNEQSPTTTYTGATEIRSFSANKNIRAYWAINISNVSNTQEYAIFNVNISSISNQVAGLNIEFYYCSAYTDMDSITWNNQPAGITLDQTLGTCNATIQSEFVFNNLDVGYMSVNMTNVTNTEIDTGDKLFTIMARFDNEDYDATGRSVNIREHDYSTVNQQPYFNFSNYDNAITFKAKDIVTTDTIQTFNVTFFNETDILNSTTTNGTILFPVQNGEYNATIYSSGYNISTATFNLNNDPITHTFYVSPSPSLNFSVYDEVLGLPDGYITESIQFNLIGSNYASNYTVSDNSLYISGVPAGDYRLTSTSANYGDRDLYVSLSNDVASYADFYLLTNANGTDVTFNVQDNSGEPLEDATVSLKRYYVNSNSYLTVAMSKTDFEGKSIIDLDFCDAFYQVVVTKNSTTTQTAGSRICDTDLYITLNTIADPFESTDAVNDVSTVMNFNNNTQTWSYTFNNPTGTNVIGTIEVNKVSSSGNTNVCTNTATSSGATLLCQVNTTETTGNYIASGYINPQLSNTKTLTDISEVTTGFRKEAKDVLGNQSLFLSILFGGVLAGLGIANPAIAIVMFLVGLGSMIYIGFSMIGIAAYITIVILGLAVVFKLRT